MSNKSAYLNEEKIEYQLKALGKQIELTLEGLKYQFQVVELASGVLLKECETGKSFYCHQSAHGLVLNGKTIALSARKARQSSSDQGGDNELTTPMPGKIIKVFVSEGQKISKGSKLYAMEAMKMEHTIMAPYDTEVEKVFYQEGDQVEANVMVVQIKVDG